MNKLSSLIGRRALSASVFALGLAATAQFARADAIPYPTPGVIDTVTYSFTAANDGDITAYFAGSTASYDNQLGLLVNGVSTGVIGLDNHTSAIGQSLDLGSVHAGDILTFVLINNALGMKAYSDPSMNVGYDSPSWLGSHNHIYSTPYTATSPVLGSIPTGTFVSFEDLPYPNSDFNYNDEDFVFTNVKLSTSVPETGSCALLLGIGMAALALFRRRCCA